MKRMERTQKLLGKSEKRAQVRVKMQLASDKRDNLIGQNATEYLTINFHTRTHIHTLKKKTHTNTTTEKKITHTHKKNK